MGRVNPVQNIRWYMLQGAVTVIWNHPFAENGKPYLVLAFWDNPHNQEAMPTLNLFTNVPVDSVIASDILKDCTKAVAKIIGKPESVGSFLYSPFCCSSCCFFGFLFSVLWLFVHLCCECYLFDDITLWTSLTFFFSFTVFFRWFGSLEFLSHSFQFVQVSYSYDLVELSVCMWKLFRLEICLIDMSACLRWKIEVSWGKLDSSRGWLLLGFAVCLDDEVEIPLNFRVINLILVPINWCLLMQPSIC